MLSDGTEIDRPVQKVQNGFTKSFTSDPVEFATNKIDKVIVALWRWKVSKNECHNGEGGGPCEWCKKNGYHMEGRIDSTEATQENF